MPCSDYISQHAPSSLGLCPPSCSSNQPREVALHLLGSSVWMLWVIVLPLSSNVTSPERLFQSTLYKTAPSSHPAPAGSIFIAPCTPNIPYVFAICPPLLMGKVQTLCFLPLADFQEPREVPGHGKPRPC